MAGVLLNHENLNNKTEVIVERKILVKEKTLIDFSYKIYQIEMGGPVSSSLSSRSFMSGIFHQVLV